MSVKNRIVIYSATGVDIIFGWNIKRISNGDYRLGDIVYPFKFPYFPIAVTLQEMSKSPWSNIKIQHRIIRIKTNHGLISYDYSILYQNTPIMFPPPYKAILYLLGKFHVLHRCTISIINDSAINKPIAYHRQNYQAGYYYPLFHYFV